MFSACRQGVPIKKKKMYVFVRGWTTENRSELPSGATVDRWKDLSVCGSSAERAFLCSTHRPTALSVFIHRPMKSTLFFRYYTAFCSFFFFINSVVPYDRPVVVYSSCHILIVVILLKRSYVSYPYVSKTSISRLATTVSVPMPTYACNIHDFVEKIRVRVPYGCILTLVFSYFRRRDHCTCVETIEYINTVQKSVRFGRARILEKLYVCTPVRDGQRAYK